MVLVPVLLLLLLQLVVPPPWAEGRAFDRPQFMDAVYNVRDWHKLAEHIHGRRDQHDPGYDRQFILGSYEAVERYDNASPEESRQHLQQLLPQMDTSGDEQIDMEELYRWILRSFRSLEREAAQHRHRVADSDSSGLLSWPEYLGAAFNISGGGGSVNSSLRAMGYSARVQGIYFKKVAREQQLFNLADKDGDGQLTGEEFILFSDPGQDPPLLEAAVRQALEKDLDGDGRLTFDESFGDEAYLETPNRYRYEQNLFLGQLDLDSDGRLDERELRYHFSNPNHADVHQEVTHLMDHTDADLDGRMSFQEVMDNSGHFVGSQHLLQGEGRLTDEL